jgi:putative transposase
MTNIRRYFREGQVYLLTHVTAKRYPLLLDHIDIFWRAHSAVIAPSGTDLIAWVVLPEHFHIIVDPHDGDLSLLMKRFKLKFSGLCRTRLGLSRGRVWQYRFWDHVIRDQEDLRRHIDYIHFNPVKHGLVKDPFEYEHSSLRKYFEEGHYSRDWGCQQLIKFDGDFGE